MSKGEIRRLAAAKWSNVKYTEEAEKYRIKADKEKDDFVKENILKNVEQKKIKKLKVPTSYMELSNIL